MLPVVKAASEAGITLGIENIFDVDPAMRREMVDSFQSDAIALSIDTGHAHLARRMSGAPPVDYFVRDAGHSPAGGTSSANDSSNSSVGSCSSVKPS
ncbi:MAG: hypothetical protein AAF088_20510 [Pseudomonadota bacterium]